MRLAFALACAFALFFAGCAAPETVLPAATTREAPAAQEATEQNATGPFHAEGVTTFSVVGACEPVLGGCAPLTSGKPGAFSTNGTKGAKLHAAWQHPPTVTAVRVWVKVGEKLVEAKGTGSVDLDLGDVPAGDHKVGAWPEAAAGTADLKVAWTVDGS